MSYVCFDKNLPNPPSATTKKNYYSNFQVMRKGILLTSWKSN